ncbi:CpaD family pilus assembly protein [Allosphingosinicella sp.]|uniref:CpaD family pilus assembly protein n=1 Tax=Allosphingosinicella sp. TaxID=2823234 RepID=UPI003783C6A7
MSRLIRIAAVSAIGLAMASCAGSGGQNRPLTAASNYSVYSVHQPTVEHTNFVFDLRVDGDRVSEAEMNRLAAWFHSIDARYGDRISIDTPRGYASAGARADVGRVASDFGLLLAAESAPITQGDVAPGTIRVVASRASAHVEGCPSYSGQGSGMESPARTDSNYGCATNSNLAAMIADPDDLVRGREGNGSESAQVAGRAVGSYRSRQPTGSQPLPAPSTRNSGGGQ